MDYTLDESYTPEKISIRIGTSFHDLQEAKIVNLHEPKGWVSIQFTEPLKTTHLQLAIIQNHPVNGFHGKDTHLRQVKIFGPQPAM